jgi:hypothetical protein
MARPAYGGRRTCESCRSIDIRRWHREGGLRAGRSFSGSWTCHREPSAHVDVRTETDAVALVYRSRSPGTVEWKLIEQRVAITWTACHFGGRRPWFICPVCSRDRGRRVAVLYELGGLFACRYCCGLAYACQQETPMYRGLAMAQKIRKRLAGSTDIFDAFPAKPKGMHWTTYDRLQLAHEAAKERALAGLARITGGR